MRVVCISEDCGWDAFGDEGVKKGNIYTAIDEIDGYGRFWWWPFSIRCYVLAGFDDDSCFPCRCFVQINENYLDELELSEANVIEAGKILNEVIEPLNV